MRGSPVAERKTGLVNEQAPRPHLGPLPAEGEILDPATNQAALCRKVHPFQASKSYLCPGCGNDILVGMGHYVVVPHFDPGWRRHWHETCLRRAFERGPKSSNHSKGRRRRDTAKARGRRTQEPT